MSLVAILDADKEGFLRNRRSLIQTIGRAARNAQGKVIMYADTMTDSMRSAISETRRRRALQEAFNEQHGITPQTVKKSLTDVSSFIEDAHQNLDKRSRKDGTFFTPSTTTAEQLADEMSELSLDEVHKIIASLEEEMVSASGSMDFERAATLRDQLVELKALVEGTSEDEIMRRLKAGARKGSTHATRRRYNRHGKH